MEVIYGTERKRRWYAKQKQKSVLHMEASYVKEPSLLHPYCTVFVYYTYVFNPQNRGNPTLFD